MRPAGTARARGSCAAAPRPGGKRHHFRIRGGRARALRMRRRAGERKEAGPRFRRAAFIPSIRGNVACCTHTYARGQGLARAHARKRGAGRLQRTAAGFLPAKEREHPSWAFSLRPPCWDADSVSLLVAFNRRSRPQGARKALLRIRVSADNRALRQLPGTSVRAAKQPELLSRRCDAFKATGFG